MNDDKLITEARARIIWGESASSVHDFLSSNGLPERIASAKIEEFVLERNRELKNIGIRNIVVGLLLAGAAGIVLYIWFPRAAATSGIIRGLAVVVVVLLIGLWKLVSGIVYLVFPQTEHKSIPDITEQDILN